MCLHQFLTTHLHKSTVKTAFTFIDAAIPTNFQVQHNTSSFAILKYISGCRTTTTATCALTVMQHSLSGRYIDWNVAHKCTRLLNPCDETLQSVSPSVATHAPDAAALLSSCSSDMARRVTYSPVSSQVPMHACISHGVSCQREDCDSNTFIHQDWNCLVRDHTFCTCT